MPYLARMKRGAQAPKIAYCLTSPLRFDRAISEISGRPLPTGAAGTGNGDWEAALNGEVAWSPEPGPLFLAAPLSDFGSLMVSRIHLPKS
jgi:hypothetical protein